MRFCLAVAALATIIVPERADSADAKELIAKLEQELDPRYPEASRHGYCVEKLLCEAVAFFVTRHDGMPAGCGGVQFFGADYGEIKRMYVRPGFRGRGLGRLMLNHLAAHVRQQGIAVLRLETGIYQSEAIGLYERFGFRRTAPFGPTGTTRSAPFTRCASPDRDPERVAPAPVRITHGRRRRLVEACALPLRYAK